MSIKVGEVDAGQIVDNEFRIGALERILDWLIANNPQLTQPTQADINRMRRETVEVLRKKYPNSGINYTEA